MTHQAIYVEDHGFLTTADSGRTTMFTEDPSEALHFCPAIAEVIAEGLKDGSHNMDHLRVGLVEWV